ncbi:MAG: hypothetical protein HYV60_00255 [Planctomycetia bacterium]|nr:hypothetical protein [Planctomycetia bacterium]
MSSLLTAGKSWCAEIIAGWNRFWFTPSDPHTLALLRILAGAMLLYTHLVWAKDLIAFLGPHSWIPREASMELHRGTYAWSHLWYIDSPAILWAQHVVVLVVVAMFMVGLFSRVTSVLACLLTISYCHRLEGALFGLDQVNAMLAMYLMIGPCGAVYSVDRWIAKRKAGDVLPRPVATTGCNIAIRLIQVHLCILYARHDLAGPLSVVDRIAESRHGHLGGLLLLSCLATRNAPDRAGAGGLRSWRHRVISWNDHVRNGDDHRQHGVSSATLGRTRDELSHSTTGYRSPARRRPTFRQPPKATGLSLSNNSCCCESATRFREYNAGF